MEVIVLLAIWLVQQLRQRWRAPEPTLDFEAKVWSLVSSLMISVDFQDAGRNQIEGQTTTLDRLRCGMKATPLGRISRNPSPSGLPQHLVSIRKP